MSEFRIERDIAIEAPVEVVWKTVTEPDQLSQRVRRPGGTCRGGRRDGRAAESRLIPWNQPHGEAPVAGNSMLVEFALTPEGPEPTRLRVVESGHELRDWPDAGKQRYADEHREGWGEYLNRLAGVLTKRGSR